MNLTMTGIFAEDGEVVMLDPITNEPYYLLLEPDTLFTVSNLGTYPPKQAIGDWTRGNHEVLSFYTQSETTGGGQIKEANEATDQSRFWWATLNTSRPRQVHLLQKSYKIEHASGDTAIPLGDYNDVYLAAFGTQLCTVTPNGATDATATPLDATPLFAGGVAFKGNHTTTRFFIPMGGSGYQIWDGTGLSALLTDCLPISFLVWDNKLYALQDDGKLMESLTGEADWVEKTAVEPSTTPRMLVDFYNRQDEPAIHIVTRRGVFGVDLATGARPTRTKLTPPPHPDAGLAAAQWNADLYVSYGLGKHQYTGNSIIATGLDRNAGLPSAYRGRIVSMVGGYTGLYLLVRGAESSVVSGDIVVADSAAHEPQFDAVSGRTFVMLWNAFGHHTVWVADTDADISTGIQISAAGGDEWLWWGHGAALYCQDLSATYFNPEERPDSVEYEVEGAIEWPEWDFDMTGQDKLLHMVEVRSSEITETETITVEASIDRGAWTELGQITSQPARGMTRFMLGQNGLMPDNATPRHDGIVAEKIQCRAHLRRGADASKTPVLESISVVFHKLMGQLRAYQFVTDTSGRGRGEYKGRTAAEIQDFLQRQVAGRGLVPMLHQGSWRSVRFAGVSGDDTTGVERSGIRNVAVLEVLD